MIIDEFHKGRKKSIEKRLEEAVRFNYDREPTLTAKSMRYEVAEKTEAIDVGGIGMIHKLALESGLVGAINSKVRLLKFTFSVSGIGSRFEYCLQRTLRRHLLGGH